MDEEELFGCHCYSWFDEKGSHVCCWGFTKDGKLKTQYFHEAWGKSQFLTNDDKK